MNTHAYYTGRVVRQAKLDLLLCERFSLVVVVVLVAVIDGNSQSLSFVVELYYLNAQKYWL